MNEALRDYKYLSKSVSSFVDLIISTVDSSGESLFVATIRDIHVSLLLTVLYRVQCTLYIVHCTLYTVPSMFLGKMRTLE